jgi:DNA-binding NtrC family response regulator
MPPLRKRVEDIPLLVSRFLQNYCQKMGKKMKRVAPEVIGCFETYAWPGNVRELENVIERIVAIEDRETITAAALPREMISPPKRVAIERLIPPGFNLTNHLDEVSKAYINEARVLAGGNLRKTASLLGISYRSLRHLITKYRLREAGKMEREAAQKEHKPLH